MEEPVRAPASVDYQDLAEYLRAWPDKLVEFFCARLCEDGWDPCVRELYEYVCVPDRDGPGFEEWRRT